MMNLSRFIFLLILLLYGFTCDVEECEEFIVGNTSLEFSIFPTNSVFEIGDTIKLKNLSGSNFLLNENQGSFDHAYGEMVLLFDLFKVNENNEPIRSGTSAFEISQNGTRFEVKPSSNNISRLIIWECGSVSCPLLINLIPKEIGYYGFRLLNGTIREYSDCIDITLEKNRINVADNNINILTQINTDTIIISEEVRNDFASFANLDGGEFYFRVE